MRVEPLSLRQPLTETCAVAARAADSCSEAYTPTPSLIQIMREERRVRMPDLANAPLLEARLCQYEDTPDKDLLIDRHPEAANVWFVGEGSDLGFTLAPASASMSHNSSWEGSSRRPGSSSPEAASQRQGLFELRGRLVSFTLSSLIASI